MAVAALLSGVSAVEIKREPLLTWAPSAKAGGYPKDYFVPHFGEDHDISSTKKNVADAEKKYSHVLDTSGPPDPPPRDYFVPHFGEDTDIKLTKKSRRCRSQIGPRLGRLRTTRSSTKRLLRATLR